MGKSTISMAIFNSYVSLPEDNPYFRGHIDLDYPLISGCSINYLDKPLENDLKGVISVRKKHKGGGRPHVETIILKVICTKLPKQN